MPQETLISGATTWLDGQRQLTSHRHSPDSLSDLSATKADRSHRAVRWRDERPNALKAPSSCAQFLQEFTPVRPPRLEPTVMLDDCVAQRVLASPNANPAVAP
jgi:hypothetical protein